MLFFIISGVQNAYAAQRNEVFLQLDSPYIYVRGVQKELVPGENIKPVVENGTALAPIKTIIEGLGGVFFWDEAEKKITIRHNNKTVILWVGKNNAVVKDYLSTHSTKMDIGPKTIQGNTMVPLKFVSLNLGFGYGWTEKTKTISISADWPIITPELITIEDKISKIDGGTQSNVQSQQQEYREINKLCDTILEKETDKMFLWQAMYYKGRALQGLQMNEEAIKYFNDSLKLIQEMNIPETIRNKADKAKMNSQLADLHYYLSRAQIQRNDKEKAIENLRKAVKLDRSKYIEKFKKDDVFQAIRKTDEGYNLIGVKLLIDGNKYSEGADVIIKNGKALAPFREIAEALGGRVEWNEAAQTITIKRLKNTIVLHIGSMKAEVNGKKVTLSVAPMILQEEYNNEKLKDYKDQWVLIPADFIAEMFGQKVKWKEDYVYENSKYPVIIVSEDESKLKYTKEQRRWAVAPGASLHLENYGIYDVMGGNYRSLPQVLSVRGALEDGWGIYNREDFFETLDWLKNKGHTQSYKELEKELGAIGLQRLKNTVQKDKENTPFKVKFYLKYKDKLKGKGLIAWDYCRISVVAGWSYIAGYISIEEAYDISIGAAKVLQKTYSSWGDMVEHYMIGYEFYSEQDRTAQGTGANIRDKINKKILQDAKSPWRTLPWTLNLNK